MDVEARRDCRRSHMRIWWSLAAIMGSNGSRGRSWWKRSLLSLISGMILAVGWAVRYLRYLRTLPIWSRDKSVTFGRIRMQLGRFLLSAHSWKYRIILVMVSVLYWALMVLLTLGKLWSWWTRMQGQWVQSKYGTTLW